MEQRKQGVEVHGTPWTGAPPRSRCCRINHLRRTRSGALTAAMSGRNLAKKLKDTVHIYLLLLSFIAGW